MWQPIQRQTKHYGVSSGYRRRGRLKGLLQQEGTAAYHYTRRQLVAEAFSVLQRTRLIGLKNRDVAEEQQS